MFTKKPFIVNVDSLRSDGLSPFVSNKQAHDFLPPDLEKQHPSTLRLPLFPAIGDGGEGSSIWGMNHLKRLAFGGFVLSMVVISVALFVAIGVLLETLLGEWTVFIAIIVLGTSYAIGFVTELFAD